MNEEETVIELKKYRKKPVVVEAIQFTAESWDEVLEALPPKVAHAADRSEEPYLELLTLEGIMRVSEGDYIIKGIKGEYYPCKPDIFEASYESSDDILSEESSTELHNELVETIRSAITHSNGRASEWGQRAERCFEILESGLAKATGRM